MWRLITASRSPSRTPSSGAWARPRRRGGGARGDRRSVDPDHANGSPRRRQRHAELVGGRDRGDQRTQADVDQVDVRDRERDVAADHHAAGEQAVDEVDERHLALAGDVLASRSRLGRLDEVVRRPRAGELELDAVRLVASSQRLHDGLGTRPRRRREPGRRRSGPSPPRGRRAADRAAGSAPPPRRPPSAGRGSSPPASRSPRDPPRRLRAAPACGSGTPSPWRPARRPARGRGAQERLHAPLVHPVEPLQVAPGSRPRGPASRPAARVTSRSCTAGTARRRRSQARPAAPTRGRARAPPARRGPRARLQRLLAEAVAGNVADQRGHLRGGAGGRGGGPPLAWLGLGGLGDHAVDPHERIARLPPGGGCGCGGRSVSRASVAASRASTRRARRRSRAARARRPAPVRSAPERAVPPTA